MREGILGVYFSEKSNRDGGLHVAGVDGQAASKDAASHGRLLDFKGCPPGFLQCFPRNVQDGPIQGLEGGRFV
ncbi:MAG: hypothetical protein LC620_06505 [Halobacteriales archaeon]|nr:hypothetical protein [Halobacteriales archaeon]